ncbi:MAG TPA: FAD-dependent oxidoreductase [Elusimicrobiota bacterium]|nr:FAD-dependent oxidoreductase [Elusimicrobiota bacterium]
MKRKIVVVGGVAGGASAAAKARRVNEEAEIVMFERGPYVSFANCGLPYYIGGDIQERRSLLLQTPESFWKRYRVDARVGHEVLRLDRAAKTVEVKNLKTGDVFREAYDALVLAPGAGAVRPALPGIDAKNIFTVKTVPDSDAVKEFLRSHRPARAVVAGAGFIGLESAEALKRLGLDVTVVERMPQVLPPFDPDVADSVARHLEEAGLTLVLGDALKAFHGDPLATEIELASGKRIPMDMAILSIGVRPELKLAEEAGLAIGPSGGIVVDERQRTSDPDIYAAGDAVEVVQLVTGRKIRMPLAGPANKQGRVAGANAAGGRMTFPGALGTAIVESLGISAAKTGLSEQEARAAGLRVGVSLTHSLDHAGYYPGAEPLHMKLVFEEGSGRLLGAQIVGEKGVDKRADVLATALSARMTAADLENLDLAYAPQFSSAKDPVIMGGFVAANAVRGEIKTVTCGQLLEKQRRGEPVQVVDVRTPAEYDGGHLESARLIPIDVLRERISELDPKKETVVYCRVGFRGYLAARILQQNGFGDVFNLTGGILACPSFGRRKSAGTGAGPTTEILPDGRLTAVGLKKRLAGGAVVVDVREEDEYRYEHIGGTRNVPLGRLAAELPSFPKDREMAVLCQTGVRTAQALKILKNAGFDRVRAVQGGLEAWKDAGLAVERRRGPIPLLRQVQIVAGTLALFGGLIVPLRWVAVFVGAGLVFAGISGKCGLAELLAKLPWNRHPEEEKPAGGCGPCA